MTTSTFVGGRRAVAGLTDDGAVLDGAAERIGLLVGRLVGAVVCALVGAAVGVVVAAGVLPAEPESSLTDEQPSRTRPITTIDKEKGHRDTLQPTGRDLPAT